jgi:hypothetical protein
MSGDGRPSTACHACGFGIPLADFLIWPGDDYVRMAACPSCAAANSVDPTAPVAGAAEHKPNSSVVAATVFPARGDTWRATCDCSATCVVASQHEGWSWVLAHDCAPVDL